MKTRNYFTLLVFFVSFFGLMVITVNEMSANDTIVVDQEQDQEQVTKLEEL